MSVYAMGPPGDSERFAQQVAELADDAATEGQHADDEDDALDDRDPRAELRQVVLERHHDERVLPAPLGPMSAWIVPRRTRSDTSFTATNPWNSLVRPSLSRMTSSAI